MSIGVLGKGAISGIIDSIPSSMSAGLVNGVNKWFEPYKSLELNKNFCPLYR